MSSRKSAADSSQQPSMPVRVREADRVSSGPFRRTLDTTHAAGPCPRPTAADKHVTILTEHKLPSAEIFETVVFAATAHASNFRVQRNSVRVFSDLILMRACLRMTPPDTAQSVLPLGC